MIVIVVKMFKVAEGSPSAVVSFQGALHLNTVLIKLRIKVYCKYMCKNLKPKNLQLLKCFKYTVKSPKGSYNNYNINLTQQFPNQAEYNDI